MGSSCSQKKKFPLNDAKLSGIFMDSFLYIQIWNLQEWVLKWFGIELIFCYFMINVSHLLLSYKRLLCRDNLSRALASRNLTQNTNFDNISWKMLFLYRKIELMLFDFCVSEQGCNLISKMTIRMCQKVATSDFSIALCKKSTKELILMIRSALFSSHHQT